MKQRKPREDGGMKGKEEKAKKTGWIIKPTPPSLFDLLLPFSPFSLNSLDPQRKRKREFGGLLIDDEKEKDEEKTKVKEEEKTKHNQKINKKRSKIISLEKGEEKGKRSKEEREGEDDQEGIWDRQEEKERKPFDQRGHWKKKEGLWGREEGFSRINHQGFLDSCSV